MTCGAQCCWLLDRNNYLWVRDCCWDALLCLFPLEKGNLEAGNITGTEERVLVDHTGNCCMAQVSWLLCLVDKLAASLFVES